MKTFLKKKPREFEVGNSKKFKIKDFGKILLNSDEQITFLTTKKSEYDVTKKDWGFYATPSLNGRLKNFGLRGVLIKNIMTNRFFIFLVENGKEKSFQKYLEQEKLKIIVWLDDEKKLNKI
tara:strand:- start:47527 stop:47889 length:363 start_codon:yes stop_codon:yes gene_type:complete